MKRTYQRPSIITVALRGSHLLCTSMKIDDNSEHQIENESEFLNKRYHDYNVWDDNWSK